MGNVGGHHKLSRAGRQCATGVHPEPAVQQQTERRIDSEHRSGHQLPLPTMSDFCLDPLLISASRIAGAIVLVLRHS
jgi:hypothetical protein